MKNKVDDSHPLAYGLGKTYYSLKTSSATFALQKGLWNVIHVPKAYDSYGFIGSGMKKEWKNLFLLPYNPMGRVRRSSWWTIHCSGILGQRTSAFANAVFLNGYIPQNY